MPVHCPFDNVEQRVFIEPSDRFPECEGNLLPDHGSGCQRLSRLLTEARDATLDHLPQEQWHDDAVEFSEGPPVVARREHCLFGQGAQEFGGEQRVALGMPIEIGDEPIFIRPAETVTRRDEGAECIHVESSQLESEPVCLAHERRQLHGKGMEPRQVFAAVCDDQQDGPVP